MATFPDSNTIKPLVGYEPSEIENVRRNPSEAGDTQIRDVWAGLVKFAADFEMDLSAADARTVILFWRANRATTFTFYDYDPSVGYEDISIGTGNGSNLTFTIPAKETTISSGVAQTTQPAVYVNDVLKTVVTHYNITVATGALGEDRVVFTAGNAPANGLAVTIDFTGRRQYECEFLEFSRPVISSTGRKLIRVRVEEAF